MYYHCLSITPTNFHYRPYLSVLYIIGTDIVDPGRLHALVTLCPGISNVHGMFHKRSSK